MSNEALNWALAQKVSKSSAKFVLVVMANHANDDMKCWPSYKALTEATGQDVKTVEVGLRRLRESGFIVDTGERRGHTGSVVVYQLRTPEIGATSTPAIGKPKVSNTPKNGDVDNSVSSISTPENGAATEVEAPPNFPISTPVFPGKHPQISHEAPPKTGDGTIKEPSRNHQEPKDKSDDFADLLDGVDEQVLIDFKALRKKKNAPITRTALKRMAGEAVKAGYSMNDAMSTCCARGWTGFEAAWVAGKATEPQPRNGSRHTGFDKRNYEGTQDGSIPA